MTDISPLLARFPELMSSDEARKSLYWFEHKAAGEPELEGDWQRARRRMQQANEQSRIIRALPPLHDFWLCKRANPAPRPENYLLFMNPDFEPWSVQTWQPPQDWRQWPTFGVKHSEWLQALDSRPTRPLHSATPSEAPTADARPRAVSCLVELERQATSIADRHFVSLSVAWLDVAVGRLGRWMDDSPRDIDPRILVADIVNEVLPYRSKINADLMEGCLARNFGSIRDPTSGRLVSRPTPRGQSSEWRDYFRALGYGFPRELMLVSVQLSALLLRSESMWQALLAVRSLEGPNEEAHGDLHDLGIGLFRRWFLALKALAWLESSLQRSEPFAELEPADLSSFAITSLLPIYPRPLLAISHRSTDTKAALLKSPLWGANEVALDATFRPEWQTNRAMVWSLFAATPVLARIRSPRYQDSRWCRLESEIFEHLQNSSDFLEGRRCLDLELDQLSSLDGAAQSSPKSHRFLDGAAGVDSPPLELMAWKPWQGAMLRAVSASRFVHRFLVMSDIELPDGLDVLTVANRVIESLFGDRSSLSEESLFGIDRIWHRLAEGLEHDAGIIHLEGPLARVRRADSSAEAEAWFQSIATSMPDPETGWDFCDILAAFDWRQHLEPFLTGHNAETIFENQAGFIDLRFTSAEEWIENPGWTVARGLIFLRLPYPLILRQRAGQEVESWPLIRDLDLPIYTEHSPEQGVPQSEAFFSLADPWPAHYLEAIGEAVELDPHLVFACQESWRTRQVDDPVVVRSDRGLEGFSMSGDKDDFKNWLIQRGLFEEPG